MRNHKHFTLIEHHSLFLTKESEPVSIDGHIGLPEKTFYEIEQFVLQNTNDTALFLQPSYMKPFGKTLKAQQFVGVIETRSGIAIEILPKIANDTDESRQIFMKMLKNLHNSPFKLCNTAHLKAEKLHLLEIFILMFCEELALLIKKGIRSNYITLEENATFLKGKLKLTGHIRKNIINKDRFFIEHDEYLQNRIENRIIRTTLDLLYKKSCSNSNKKRLLEYLFVFNEIEPVLDTKTAFTKVCADRQLKDYELLLQWCRLFLNHESFATFKGNNLAFALLFDMNKVFEDYVAHCLQRDFSYLTIEVQVRKEHLIEYPKREFLLKPDLKIGSKIIADTKWKLLDSSQPHNGISQTDIYQMFAYGKKYSGTKEIHLIYPKTDSFPDIVNREFHFDKDELTLQIFPFDCKEGKIEGYDEVVESAGNASCKNIPKNEISNIQTDGIEFQMSKEMYKAPENQICYQ